MQELKNRGVKLIVLRCAGFNQIDLKAAKSLDIKVVRVPAYSPYAVAEHALALILTLNRKIHRAYLRVREGNFSLDGLLGFDLHGKTLGIIGTGKIGQVMASITQGMGMKVLGYDPYPAEAFTKTGASYVSDIQELYHASDIISLHCPLTPETFHLINEDSLKQMKKGVMVINTSRGAVIEARAMIKALKKGQVGYLGLDVYEEEADLFFEDLSGQIIQDDVFSRLQSFPNVIITGHQSFFTDTAMHNIARISLENITQFEKGEKLANEVVSPNI
jgi:D-lactate dehydrogenase